MSAGNISTYGQSAGFLQRGPEKEKRLHFEVYPSAHPHLRLVVWVRSKKHPS